MDSVVQTEEINSVVSAINNLGDFANNYGFMMLFSVIVLLIVLISAVIFITRMSKKSKNELELTSKERTQVMEHTDKIYDLLYTVQTKQVTDLELIADSLKSSASKADSTNLIINNMEHDINTMKTAMNNVDGRTNMVISTINDILERVKISNECNRDILSKVNLIESIIYTDHQLSHVMHPDVDIMHHEQQFYEHQVHEQQNHEHHTHEQQGADNSSVE